MIKVAVTGTMSMGKSFIMKALQSLGMQVFSSDEEVHKILQTDQEIKKYIKEKFPEVIKGQEIDKIALAKIIFEDDKILQEYEKILYKILEKRRGDFLKNSSQDIIFFEVPLLFEKKLEKNYQYVILANADENIVKERIKDKIIKYGIDLTRKILSHQIPNKAKFNKVDFIIDTGKDKQTILNELQEIIKKIKSHERNNT
jgi:dephospho-CoA kinase